MSSLYFLAVIPPEPVFSEVMAFKKEMSERFSSSRALKSPPHITLLPPVQGNEDFEEL